MTIKNRITGTCEAGHVYELNRDFDDNVDGQVGAVEIAPLPVPGALPIVIACPHCDTAVNRDLRDAGWVV